MKNWKGFFGNTRKWLGFGDEQQAEKYVNEPNIDMGKKEKKTKALNLQSIRQEMVENFKFQLLDNSFENCLLFPMVATVILHEKDFERRREYFYELGNNAVDQFYAVIREQMKDGKEFKNMATYWKVEFVKCINGESVEYETENVYVKEGQVMTFFSVYDNLGDIKDGTDANISYSVKFSDCDDYREMNINRDMIKNFEIISDTQFKYPWDEDKITDGLENKVHTKSQKTSKAVASFEYMENFESRTFLMNGNQCRISGISEKGSGDNICRLASPSVKAGHVNVQYFPDEQKFKISTTGDTMLNDKQMPLSTGTDVVWLDLPDKSEIILARCVIVHFNKLV